jgi:hypothetical protein
MAFHGGLSSNTLANLDIFPGSGSANVNSNLSVDMQGWDGVAFYIAIGAITGLGTYSAYVQRSAAANMGSPTNVANAALSTACTTANTLCVLEVWRPSQRYVQCCLSPLVNTVVYSVVSVRYRRGGLLPPTQAATQRVLVAEN